MAFIANRRHFGVVQLTIILTLAASVLWLSVSRAALPPPGSLDPNFGSGGTVSTSFGSEGICNAVLVQVDQKIVAIGAGLNAQQKRVFALARYNTDGSPDSGFGTGGQVTTDPGGVDQQALAGALQTDGKIVAAGLMSTVSGQPEVEFALVRYNTDGSVDTNFGSSGIVLTPIRSFSEAQAVAIQADGKIVAAGFIVDSHVTGQESVAIARYMTDGSLDPGFGSAGIVIIDFAGGGEASAIQIQPDHKIVLGGNTDNGPVFRLNADGSMDTGFGAQGFATSVISGQTLFCNGIALQGDGKIVAGGGVLSGATNEFAVARYNADGSVDTGFGTQGGTFVDMGDTNVVHRVAIGAGGTIIAAGESLPPALPGEVLALDKFALLVLDANGIPNSGFGTGGKVVSDFGKPCFFPAVALQSDGNIVMSGTSSASTTQVFPQEFILARYIGLRTATPTPTPTPTPAAQMCLRDNTSPVFMQLSQSGAYTFKNCATGETLTGTGTVRIVNNVLMLTDNRPDRRVTASYYLNQLNGSAIVTLIPAPGVYQTTRIIDTVPNASCSCQ